jgi:hypothetical protein
MEAILAPTSVGISELKANLTAVLEALSYDLVKLPASTEGALQVIAKGDISLRVLFVLLKKR